MNPDWVTGQGFVFWPVGSFPSPKYRDRGMAVACLRYYILDGFVLRIDPLFFLGRLGLVSGRRALGLMDVDLNRQPMKLHQTSDTLFG